MVLAGHSMAGFNMRIFNSRNPNLVKAIVFADPVNPDFILYPKFGGRYRNNPIYNFGSFFLAPTGIQYLFMTLSSLGSHSDPGEQTKRARLFICFFFFTLRADGVFIYYYMASSTTKLTRSAQFSALNTNQSFPIRNGSRRGKTSFPPGLKTPLASTTLRGGGGQWAISQ